MIQGVCWKYLHWLSVGDGMTLFGFSANMLLRSYKDLVQDLARSYFNKNMGKIF